MKYSVDIGNGLSQIGKMTGGAVGGASDYITLDVNLQELNSSKGILDNLSSPWRFLLLLRLSCFLLFSPAAAFCR